MSKRSETVELIEQNGFFPNFCQADRLLGVMVAAELVALIMVLAVEPDQGFSWRDLGLVSMFVQWIACVSTILLCALRTSMNRLPEWLAFTGALLIVLVITAIASWSSDWFATIIAPDLRPTMPLKESLLRNMVISGLVGAAMLRYIYVQSEWQRQILAHSEARLKSLQARIRPHFLFNTLNAVMGLLRTRPEQAEETLENLSDLFRAALTSPGRQHTLDDELSLCLRYLDIEQVRLGDRLRLQWEVDALPGHSLVPALIVQPLIENAVVHGIQQLPEGGILAVSGEYLNDQVCIHISNPMPPADQHRSYDGGHGLALENIRQRLQHRFGSSADLVFEVSDQSL